MTGTTSTGTTPTTAARWRRLIGLPIAAVGVVTLAACGASTSSTGTTASGTTGTTTAGVERQALRSCLSENGVTLPSRGAGGEGGTGGGAPPSGGAAPTGTPSAGGQGGADRTGGRRAGSGQAPPGVDATTWAKAQKACAQYLPSGAASATATNGA